MCSVYSGLHCLVLDSQLYFWHPLVAGELSRKSAMHDGCVLWRIPMVHLVAPLFVVDGTIFREYHHQLPPLQNEIIRVKFEEVAGDGEEQDQGGFKFGHGLRLIWDDEIEIKIRTCP